MTEAVDTALKPVADHPLIAFAFLIFGFLPWLDGGLRELRFIGEILIIAIRFLKHELKAWKEFLGRLKREVST